MMLLPGDCAVVVPWHRRDEIEGFLQEWVVHRPIPDWLVLQRDAEREGCGVTKNKGIAQALDLGARTVVVLDGDCYPSSEIATLERLAAAHLEALEPQLVELFEAVTDPPSRGTPYTASSVKLPVAASVGFWEGAGDYCAVRQLALGVSPMEFRQETMFWRYFPLCGMNLAFKPREWLPWCRFIDAPRFDDIWMGWLWQREAYRRGFCFNLVGPLVRHARQSDVWSNLLVEAAYLQASETLWRDIAMSEAGDYETLRDLLPC